MRTGQLCLKYIFYKNIKNKITGFPVTCIWDSLFKKVQLPWGGAQLHTALK